MTLEKVVRHEGRPVVAPVIGECVVVSAATLGCYQLQYTCAVPGAYEMAVTIGLMHVNGSPFRVECKALPADARRCIVRGAGIEGPARQRAESSFEIATVDEFGNLLEDGGETLQVVLMGGHDDSSYEKVLTISVYKVL